MTDKTDDPDFNEEIRNEKIRLDIKNIEKQIAQLKTKELDALENALRSLTGNVVTALRLNCSTDEDCPSNCRCVDSRCKR